MTGKHINNTYKARFEELSWVIINNYCKPSHANTSHVSEVRGAVEAETTIYHLSTSKEGNFHQSLFCLSYLTVMK